MSKRPSTDPQDGSITKRARQSNDDSCNTYDFSTQESMDESFVGFQDNEIKKVFLKNLKTCSIKNKVKNSQSNSFYN